ncbi:trigger factor [Desulfitobacterium hafniense DCB-2]|uniref:Trigger factor n=2 Tax=Desulfitobacterium hafniense TaxID=49338 RepID=A0A098B4E5_DESHA|nr:trigger factor [Desulfitobacterium hafniense]ACL19935.1 trigger factor [Desulfitobacterium hafniense DCB-2]CDX03709.1 Trigger factor 2 [Desulfitobacterium hafniense]
MNAVLENIENSEAHFRFTIDYKVFADALEKTYKKNKKNYQVAGFRKGSVPRSVIESQYGSTVFYQEALDLIMADEYKKAVEGLALDTIGDPDIEVGEIEKGQELSVKASVPVVPEVTLGQLEGIEVVMPKAREVKKADIEKSLEELQYKNKKITDKEMEPAEKGDTVTVDYDCELDGTKFEPVVDYKALLDDSPDTMGFELQLKGARKGDILTIEQVFPQDHLQPQIAGKTACFNVTVKKVERIEMLPLDDAFAQTVGNVSTMEEFRAEIKKNLEEAAAQRVQMQRNNAILSELFKRCQVKIPESLIMQRAMSMLEQFSGQLEAEGGTLDLYLQLMNRKSEDFKREVWQDAENSLKADYILDKVIKEKGYTVSEEELNQGCEKFALSINMAPENARQNLGPLVNKVEYDLKAEKAFHYLLEHAVIREGNKMA